MAQSIRAVSSELKAVDSVVPDPTSPSVGMEFRGSVRSLLEPMQIVESTQAQAVFAALGDPKWDWRTLHGIEKSTGLDASEILQVIDQHSVAVESRESRSGTLYRLRNHRASLQHAHPLQRLLDYLSFGRRRIAGS
jgi:hypothetical protein